MYEALNQSGEREYVIEAWGNIADSNFDRTEMVMWSDIPPDFADGVNEASVHQVFDEPDIFAPVAHLVRQTGGGQSLHDFRAVRVQSGAASFPER